MVKPEYMNDIYQMFDEREREERQAQPAKKVKAEMRVKNPDSWLLVPAMAAWIVSATFLAAAL